MEFAFSLGVNLRLLFDVVFVSPDSVEPATENVYNGQEIFCEFTFGRCVVVVENHELDVVFVEDPLDEIKREPA